MGGKGAALLVALLVAASILAAIPPCSADANITTLPIINLKASQPSPGSTSRRVVAVFDLQGNVYPIGKFTVQMRFGNSPYSMDVDTGSDVPWVPCQVPPMDKLIPCDDPRCKAVHASTGQKHKCKSPTGCDFKVTYHDGTSAEGVLIADTVSLPLTNGSVINPSVAFGCVPVHSSNPDGILGLGVGEISIVSQLGGRGVLGKVMGHCLYSGGRGRVFVGDVGRLPPNGITWAPMTRSKYYSLGPASLFLETRSIGSNLVVLLDSGSTYTYLALQTYNNFISALTQDVSKQPLETVNNDPTLPYCWKGPEPFSSMSDVKQYFKTSLELRFARGASMIIPPENYMIISDKANACLGILDGTEARLKQDTILIGDISMLDRWVIYDIENRRIGWGGCNRHR